MPIHNRIEIATPDRSTFNPMLLRDEDGVSD
jgi:hypothetical protein